jgi:hypothetical protein
VKFARVPVCSVFVWSLFGGDSWCEASGKSTASFMTESFAEPGTGGSFLSIVAARALAARVINGSCGSLAFAFLAVVLFVCFDFLRLAGVVDGFEPFVRLLLVLSTIFEIVGSVLA